MTSLSSHNCYSLSINDWEEKHENHTKTKLNSLPGLEKWVDIFILTCFIYSSIF